MAATHRLSRNLRFGVGDLLEAVFAPDPGMIRLRTAARTTLTAAATLLLLLFLFRSRGMKAAPVIGLGTMAGIFASFAVRDETRRGQIVTMVLLVAPALAGMAVAALASAHVWTADVGFVATAVVATVAPDAGPRGLPLGLVGLIAYMLGALLRPPLSLLPLVAVGVVVGLVIAGLVRFVLLPPRPRAAIEHIRRHLRRRTARMLETAIDLLQRGSPSPPETARRSVGREIARFSDALLTGQDQIEQAEHLDEDARRRLTAEFFALELSAERLLRLAAGPAAQEVGGLEAVTRLHRALVRDEVKSPTAEASPGSIPAAAHSLQGALAALRRERVLGGEAPEAETLG